MRLTGLAQNVATFQCISALSGTGFTTSESEKIVNYPVRRRILIVLMLFGNSGFARARDIHRVLYRRREDDLGDLDPVGMDFGCDCACLGVGDEPNAGSCALRCGGACIAPHDSFGERRFLKLLQLDDGRRPRRSSRRPFEAATTSRSRSSGWSSLGSGALIIRTCGTCARRCRSIRATF